MGSNAALRIALVWHGTVMTEKTLRLPSERAEVTIGTRRQNTFVLGGDQVPESHRLLARAGDGYTLSVPAGMAGRLVCGGDEQPVERLVGRKLHLAPGDWGALNLAGVTLFVQFVDAAPAPARWGAWGALLSTGPLATAIWFSLLAQLLVVFVARLLWDEDLDEQSFLLDDRFVAILAAMPPDAVVEQESADEAVDDTTSAAAAGEEGEFGSEDAELEDPILPDHEAPEVAVIEEPELGRALDAAIAQSGVLSNIFEPNDLRLGEGMDFATAGEGDAFVDGRGTGGWSIRGTERGGGGNSFGRVTGVGDIDTGSGRDVRTDLGQRPQREPGGEVRSGHVTSSAFLSRDQIEAVVRRHRRGITYCYERELGDDPSLEGQITLNWTIDLDGHVSRRSVEENTMRNDDVEACLLREVGRMRFPEPDGGMVVVRYPFHFRGLRATSE